MITSWSAAHHIRLVERHLRDCPASGEYLRQLRATIAATGRIDTEDLSPDTRGALVSLTAGPCISER